MIALEEACRIVLESAPRLGTEQVPIGEALGRILAEDVHSDIDMPPFNKSAMDGYACRREDLQDELEVLQTIAAGGMPEHVIGKGQCAKIMTGAMVPDGADCVIMVEQTARTADGRIRFTGERTRDNICRQAADIRKNEVVLHPGQLLTPACIAVLASIGCPRPVVSRRPRVGIIATGDELVAPTMTPGASQIRDSNSAQLYAQCRSAGAQPTQYGIAADTAASTDRLLKRAMAENDVILLSGGVSVGDFDVVPAVLEANGIRLLFDAVAMKPGRPSHFGVAEETVCFALPGNPVATLVQFEIIIKPLLHKMMGHALQPREVELPLAREVRRRRADRIGWLPVAISPERAVEPLEYHGSAHVHALAAADALLPMAVGTTTICQGTCVRVRLL